MSKHLHADLQKLERSLLALGDRIEENVRRAIQSFSAQRIDTAEEVIHGDQEIDRQEVALEEECLKVLALHQPVAGDLRFVTACMKITNDLERIGDLAVNIAKRVRALTKERADTPPPELSEMTDLTAIMLRSALDAFIRVDGHRARQLLVDDDRIDELHKRCIQGLIEEMQASPERIPALMSFISVSRYLERMADHTTNIAEDVIYLADGDIVRHQRDEWGAETNS